MTPFKQSLVPLIVLSLSACGNADTELRAVGTLEWDRVELTAELAEPVVHIAVREGDRVTEGQVLLQLDARRTQAQVDEARAARDQAAARLAELVRGPRAERIREARARLTGAEHIYDIRLREYQRQERLLTQKLTSPEAVDAARAALDVALTDRDTGRAVLDELEAGTTNEEIEQARQAVARAEAALRSSNITLERLTVRAPVDGRVDSLPYEQGERPPLGNVVAVVLARDTAHARVYVPEGMRVHVAPDDGARIWVDGIAESVEGRVRWVSSDPAFTPYFALTEHDRGRLSYLAQIDLVDPPRELPAGVPLDVTFGSSVKP